MQGDVARLVEFWMRLVTRRAEPAALVLMVSGDEEKRRNEIRRDDSLKVREDQLAPRAQGGVRRVFTRLFNRASLEWASSISLG